MALEGKYAAVVETSGGGDDEEVISYMERFVNTLGARSVGGVGSPAAGVRTFPDEADLFGRAQELGRELCRSIAGQRRYPEQDEFIQNFRGRMAGLIDVMKEYWPFEREQWEKKRT